MKEKKCVYYGRGESIILIGYFFTIKKGDRVT